MNNKYYINIVFSTRSMACYVFIFFCIRDLNAPKEVGPKHYLLLLRINVASISLLAFDVSNFVMLILDLICWIALLLLLLLFSSHVFGESLKKSETNEKVVSSFEYFRHIENIATI